MKIRKYNDLVEASEINFDYDYKTSDADINAKEVFDIHRSDSSYSTGLLPGSDEEEYYRDNKNKKGEIVYMTPEEYFEKCADGFNSTGYNSSVEKLKQSRMQYPGHEHIDDLKKIITEKGKKLPIPYLDYTNGFGQEGLHRMMAVAEIFGWNEEKFPVLVITYADEQKHIEDLKYQDQHKVENDIIQPATHYTFDDIEEFIDELKWQTERENNSYGWQYIKDPRKLNFDYTDGVITVTDTDSDFGFATDEYEVNLSDSIESKLSSYPGDDDYGIDEDEIDDLLAADVEGEIQ